MSLVNFSVKLALTMTLSWVKTGDIAKIDQRGEVFVIDRLKVNFIRILLPVHN